MENDSSRLLYNAICLVCFTVLAVAFNKWWLIFVAVFFWTFKTKEA